MRYYHDMLRVSLLCVVSTVVQSQTCASVSAVISGGLCDGNNLLMNKCMPVDQSTAMLFNGSRFTAASCQSDMSDVCIALRGYFNPDYCQMSVKSVPFCRNLVVAAVSTSAGLCTSDADCKTIVIKLCRTSSPGSNSSKPGSNSSNPGSNSSNAPASTTQCNTSKITLTTRPRLNVICCADIKTVATQGCTGIEMSSLDLLVNMMQDAKECGVYPNCTSSAASAAEGVLLYAGGTADGTSAAAPSACTWTLVGVVSLLLSFVFVKF